MPRGVPEEETHVEGERLRQGEMTNMLEELSHTSEVTKVPTIKQAALYFLRREKLSLSIRALSRFIQAVMTGRTDY